MVNLVGLVIAIVVIVGLGGAGAYVIWLKTRPKKMWWKANVYQLAEGVRPPVRDKHGKIVSDLKLSDLRPYARDTIEKLDKGVGMVMYKLSRLGKTVPPVTNDVVDYWGEKDKEVAVLIDGETCTILKKGYDRLAGIIFNPMPHDRINMIAGEIQLRKERLRNEKDILQAITPWIVTGIAMLGLVAIVYFAVDGFITISENLKDSNKYMATQQEKLTRMWISATGKPPLDDREITEEQPPDIEE